MQNWIDSPHSCSWHPEAISVRLEGKQKWEFIIDVELIKGIVNKICDILDNKVLIELILRKELGEYGCSQI